MRLTIQVKLGVVAAGLGLWLGALPVSAHHSFAAEYDEKKPVNVTGIVKKVEWTNPHSRMYLEVKDASGTITSFATDFIQRHKITEAFDVTPAVLGEFQVYAAEHSIQPPVAEWVREREWVQNRLKQEIFNQALGVAKGDEVEAQRDPAIRAALSALN